jgi:FtsP/CotA-like multicopper oxidase with cupredoxin domain
VIAKDGIPLATPRARTRSQSLPTTLPVLIHATGLGTWVWHCHILPHAENEHGMFGMVTALVVQ